MNFLSMLDFQIFRRSPCKDWLYSCQLINNVICIFSVDLFFRHFHFRRFTLELIDRLAMECCIMRPLANLDKTRIESLLKSGFLLSIYLSTVNYLLVVIRIMYKIIFILARIG